MCRIILVTLVTICHYVFSQRDEYTADRIFFMTSQGLDKVPDDIPDDALKVYLDKNRITSIPDDSFSNLTSCTHLFLNWNELSSLNKGSFNGLISLLGLYLKHNKFLTATMEAFSPLRSLTFLELDYNQISALEDGHLHDLIFLIVISLDGNKITEITENIFLKATKRHLRYLELESNEISAIDKGLFNDFTLLVRLNLKNNKISSIDYGDLNGLINLQNLTLESNQIQTVEPSAFVELIRLERLWLNRNLLENLQPNTFIGLKSLKFLDLGGNRISSIDYQVMAKLPRPLVLALGPMHNPWVCKIRLCWLKLEEEAGKITWEAVGGFQQHPVCVSGLDWSDLSCPNTDSNLNESSEGNVNISQTTLIGGLAGTFVGGIAVAVVVGGIIFYIKRKSGRSQPTNVNGLSTDHGEASVADYMDPVPGGSAVVNPGGESVRYIGETEGWRGSHNRGISHAYEEISPDSINPA